MMETAVHGLAEVAATLTMDETAARLRLTANQVRSGTFKIMVLGQDSTARRSLLNALLGRTTRPLNLPDGWQGPVPASYDHEDRASVTRVRYAEDFYISAVMPDGTAKSRPFCGSPGDAAAGSRFRRYQAGIVRTFQQERSAG